MDVVVERLERRDVEDLHRVRELALEAIHDETVELPEERCQRLPRAGRCEDQRVPAGRDRRPPQPLRCARRA